MLKAFKIIFGVSSVVIGLFGIYFYFIFENINFQITNELNLPIKGYITIYSNDTKTDYTYPISTSLEIKPNKTHDSFYTVDDSFEGTKCVNIIFKNLQDQLLASFPCPKEGEVLTVKESDLIFEQTK